MSRDSTGNYTSPTGPFVAGTTIDSNVMNQKLEDLGDEITASLSRNGDGAMLSPLRVPDGTINLPGYSFTNETTLGFHRAGTTDLRVVKDGTNIFKFNTTENRSYSALKAALGITVDSGGLTVTAGGLTVTAGGATVAAGGLSGRTAMPASGSTGSLNKWITGTTGTDEMASTSGNNYPLAEVESFTHNANSVRLAVRAVNRSAVTDWEQVGLGLSYDVDNSAAVGGSFYLGKTGATLTSGTNATGAAPANTLELTNGNLKLSGTAPNSDKELTRTVTPANIIAAWVSVNLNNSTSPEITDGFNIASVTITGGDLVVTLAGDFANATYAVVPSSDSPTNRVHWVSKTTGTTTFSASRPEFVDDGVTQGSTDVDMSTLSDQVDIIWTGRQT